MDPSIDRLLARIASGRTDLVLDPAITALPPAVRDADGVLLIERCAYYGDVSAIRALCARGEDLATLGADFGLNAAAFHGHWRLCEFLLEQGADANFAAADTGETPLHSALCTPRRLAHDLVVRVLLAHGADPNRATKPGVETGSFMRDCRTKGETPLHRAAAFGDEGTLDLLLAAGADREAHDMNGDTALAWASWSSRPDAILRKLCYGDFTIHPQRRPMERNVLGDPAPRGPR